MKKNSIGIVLGFSIVCLLVFLFSCPMSSEPQTYTVTFDTDGGSLITSQSVKENEKASKPDGNPTKTGYTFDGWYKESECTNEWEFESEIVVSNTTLYTKWSANSYLVTFDAQGGSTPSPETKSVTYDQTYGTLPKSTRDTYAFEGWWTEATGTGTQILSTTVASLTSEQTLYAKWFGPIVIRDPGPAGGLVFYDKGSSSDGWRYLEAASSDIEIDESKQQYFFGFYRTAPDESAVIVGTMTGIGTGQANTIALVEAMGTEAYTSSTLTDKTTTEHYAARLCDIHEQGGYSDWFLPSKDEVKQMHLNLHLYGLGDFDVIGHYWSSSESDYYDVWEQWFCTGNQFLSSRRNGNYVRPIRAF